MKKLTLCAVSISAVFAVNANAGDVQVTGYVAPVCEVQGLSSQLLDFGPVTTVGQEVSLSNVKLQCNDADGATVTLRSAEGGLESDDKEDFSIGYDAVLSTSLGDITLNVPGGYGTNETSTSQPYSGSEALADGVTGSLSFKTTQSAKWSGGYSDTLTVLIAAQ